MNPDFSSYQALLLEVKQQRLKPESRIKIASCLDLTRLQENDSIEAINNICLEAKNSIIPVAGMCVYPRYVSTVCSALKDTPIHVVSVCNFPEGNKPFDEIMNEIDLALTSGADEIDIVLPFVRNFAENRKESLEFLQQCKQVMGKKQLKVIVESALWPDLNNLYILATQIIATGADFLKTSTGKHLSGASPEAALSLLLAILAMKQQGYDCGFKASGGIRTYQQALSYLFLADSLLGEAWCNPTHFRIGTSSLFQ